MENTQVRTLVREMLKAGVTDQHLIFEKIYPLYVGHYSRLRDLISEVKNEGVN